MIKRKLHIELPDRNQIKIVGLELKTLQPGNYRIYICNDRKQRSLQQNAYYWGVVIKLISEHTGYLTNETHKKLAFMFNPEMIEVKGKAYKIPRSTTELNTKEFEEYLEQIRVWAWQELNIEIPEPGEFTEEQLIEFDSEHN